MLHVEENANEVYIVSLNDDSFCEFNLSHFEVVDIYQKYFHPIGGKGRHLTQPPNYIGFRYDAKLISIHHVDSCKKIDDYYPHFPNHITSPCPIGDEFFLYELGPAIKPNKTIPTNDPSGNYTNIYGNGRVWCFIDLLLTCDSVAEAYSESKKRKSGQQQG